MIYDELRNMITLARSDDTVLVFDQAIELFETMGIDNYMQIFEATIGSSPNMTEGETIDELLSDLHVITDGLFAVQGVTLIDDVLISDKIKMGKGLLDIFYYTDKDVICRILETDLNSEEKIAELLSLVTDIHTEEAFSLIQEVNPSVITRIQSIIKPTFDFNENDPLNQVIKSIIDTYALFKQNILDSQVFYTDKFLSTIDTVGLEFKIYLDDLLNQNKFKDLLIEMDNAPKNSDNEVFNSISIYLIGIAILSIDSDKTYINIIRQHFGEITHNVNSLTRLESAISQNIIKLNRVGKQ